MKRSRLSILRFAGLALLTVALLLAGCGGLTTGGATLGRGPNPGVFPPNSTPYGKTYREWSAVWWQWALAIPIENNPIADPTGEKAHLGQTGPVWFLAGTSGDPPIAERTCTVPANKAILFPILNVIGATPFDGETDAQVAAACRMWMDWVTEMEARVDGRALQDLGSYRFPSPIFSFTAPEAEHALFPVYAGTQTGGQSEGYWIMLEPLSPGPHTIYFRGKIVFPAVYPNVGVWETQLTYHLTVE